MLELCQIQFPSTRNSSDEINEASQHHHHIENWMRQLLELPEIAFILNFYGFTSIEREVSAPRVWEDEKKKFISFSSMMMWYNDFGGWNESMCVRCFGNFGNYQCYQNFITRGFGVLIHKIYVELILKLNFTEGEFFMRNQSWHIARGCIYLSLAHICV